MSDPVRVERNGPVTTVIIDRPRRAMPSTARRQPRYLRRSRTSIATTPRRWPYCGVITEHFAPALI